jgi:hypothetical protein
LSDDINTLLSQTPEIQGAVVLANETQNSQNLEFHTGVILREFREEILFQLLAD